MRLRQALIDGFIISWWSFSNVSINKFLEVAPLDFEIMFYYETTGFTQGKVKGSEVVDAVINDLNRILTEYGVKERWLKVLGRPVIFVYGRVISKLEKALRGTDNATKAWGTIRENLKQEAFIIGDALANLKYIDVFDEIRMYNPIGFIQGSRLFLIFIN